MNHLRANEIRFQGRLPVFEEHADDLFQIMFQLVQRIPLGMCARKPGNVADIKASVRAFLNNRRE